MSAPTMGVEDLKRLLLEIDTESEDSMEEWMERERIDGQMLAFLGEKVGRAYLFGVMVEDLDPKDTIIAVVCAMFQVGWEAHREYGGGLSGRP